jgi:hypothetical protein
VSHNEDADVLVEKDREHFDHARFPCSYPVGVATADTHLVAAALRLADILDFDRERTPPALLHYLVPGNLSHGVNISTLEWNKHLSISNWQIEHAATVFRGRCNNHIVHHSVVQFCGLIEEEIASTRATFAAGEAAPWPFVLPEMVKVEIHEDGYHYVPYQFELDDGRVYELLMGGAIYDNPLVAVRELVQNAVDACGYRDALSRLAEPHLQPDTMSRITVRYEEPTEDREYPRLTVSDTGTGMDAWAIERWFLKVGRSYYSSSEFNKDRVQLRKQGCDFAPVSEFGIGFLSCFLLADRVDVETAMWEPVRGDTRKRHLQIDGPTRLIRIREDLNAGLQRFRGTRVSLSLARGGWESQQGTPTPPTWNQVKLYLERVCQNLPYRLKLEHLGRGHTTSEVIDPKPMVAPVPAPYETRALRIPVADAAGQLEGEIAIVPYPVVRVVDQDRLKESVVATSQEGTTETSTLLRGGFNIGPVPGLPSGLSRAPVVSASVKMLWRDGEDQRYARTNLARTAASDERAIARKIEDIWLRYLIDNRAQIPEGSLYGLYRGRDHRSRYRVPRGNLSELAWLQTYSALALYELARNGWQYSLRNRQKELDPVADWEFGKGWAYISTGELYGEILELVLPRIAPERSMTRFGDVYVMPPERDWRKMLALSSDFISKPVRWSQFVHYTGDIADRLHHNWHYNGPFNKKHAKRLSAFSEEDLDKSAGLFDTLLRDRRERRPSELKEQHSALLDRLIDAAGELEISSVNGVAELNSFRRRK